MVVVAKEVELGVHGSRHKPKVQGQVPVLVGKLVVPELEECWLSVGPLLAAKVKSMMVVVETFG